MMRMLVIALSIYWIIGMLVSIAWWNGLQWLVRIRSRLHMHDIDDLSKVFISSIEDYLRLDYRTQNICTYLLIPAFWPKYIPVLLTMEIIKGKLKQ